MAWIFDRSPIIVTDRHRMELADNVITDCAHGISMAYVDGHNVICRNRVANSAPRDGAIGYNIDALPTATTEFRDNIGVNCARYIVAPKTVSADNNLK
jgi:hypothetical protein